MIMESIQVVTLPRSLNSWNKPSFNEVVKNEISAIDRNFLPLQQCLTQGSYVAGDNFSVVVLSVGDQANVIRVNAGIFYTSIIAGCSCADDPSPLDELPEYCELQFDINKMSAETSIKCFAE